MGRELVPFYSHEQVTLSSQIFRSVTHENQRRAHFTDCVWLTASQEPYSRVGPINLTYLSTVDPSHNTIAAL